VMAVHIMGKVFYLQLYNCLVAFINFSHLLKSIITITDLPR